MANEDFTTYTEVDPGDDITVAANTITLTLLPRNVSSYVYKDHGVDFFNGDFTHEIEWEQTNENNGTCSVWDIANALGDFRDLGLAGEDHILCYVNFNRIRIAVIENGANTNEDPSDVIADGTNYFLTIDRDDDGGTNSTGLMTVTIRTVSHVGPILDTITSESAVGEQNDFRYSLHSQTSNSGGAQTISGIIRNFDTNSGVVVTPLGSVWANVSQILNVYIDLPKVGFKIFEAKTREE
jgi:hypothetical protein